MKKISKILQMFFIALIFSVTVTNITIASSLSEKDDIARSKYKNAHETYVSEAAEYQDVKRNFVLTKNKFERRNSVQNKKDYEIKAQEFLAKSASVSIKYLETVRNKAENVRGISEEDRLLILADIDGAILLLNTNIDNLSGELTLEQTKEEAILIRNNWKNIKVTFKKAIAQIWIARASFVVQKAEEFSWETSQKAAGLGAPEGGNEKLDILLGELDENIVEARTKIQAADDKTIDLTDEKLSKTMKVIHDLVKGANQDIKKAHLNLIDIIKIIKEAVKDETVVSSQIVE